MMDNQPASKKVAETKSFTIPIDEILPAKYNPRIDLKPDDPDYKALERSIEEFGYVDPLILNTFNKVLISGHQRLKILKAKGYTHVSVSVVNISDEKREKAMNLAMNKIAGREDPEKLKDIFLEFETYDALVELAGYEKQEFERAKQWEDTIPDQEVGQSPGQAKEIYDQGVIKQIVLYYNNEEYSNRITRFGVISEKLKLENNTEIVDMLLDFYEKNHASKSQARQ